VCLQLSEWGGSRNFSKGANAVGSKGKAPVEDVGDEVPQKLKQSVKILYKFNFNGGVCDSLTA